MTVGFPMSCLIPMFTHECNLIRTVEKILAKTTLIKINNCILSLILFEHLENFRLDVLYEVFFFLCNEVRLNVDLAIPAYCLSHFQ